MLNSVRGFCLGLACLSLAGAAACGSASGAGSPPAGGGGRGGRGAGGGLVPVVVAKVTARDVPVDITSIGNVEALTTISVRSQVTGTLTDVRFNEGDTVKAGDQLFGIDRRPFEATLHQAEANITRDQALLAQSEAQLARDISNGDYTKAQANRQLQLVAGGLISKDLAEQAAAATAAANAVVNADRAAVEGAKAQLVAQQAMVDSAKLQLDYTIIKSPISGRTGNMMVKAGNLVSANSTELITIAQVDQVYVTFSLPATYLPDIRKHAKDGALMVTATAQNAGSTPVTGKLTFVDNSVDASTDTIKLKATFNNADHALWPGQFARVSLRVSTIAGATVVPGQAVQTGQDGQFVFVLKPDSTVEQRTVTTGAAADQDIVITSGLAVDETVVTEGQLRLEPGMKVVRADPKTGEASPGGGRGGRGGRGGQPAPAGTGRQGRE